MKKFIAVILSWCLLLTLVPILAAGEAASKEESDLVFYEGEPYSIAILDEGFLLQEDELPDLVKAMEAVAEYANVGFLTRPADGDNGNSASKAQVWGDSIFGSDTRFTVFIIDMATRHLDIYASKPLSSILTSASENSIADNVYRYASRGEYGVCAIETFKLIENVLKDEKRVSEEFLFRERIKWGMSQVEVISLEGEPDYSWEEGSVTEIYYRDTEISKYQGYLVYAFASDSLACCIYEISRADQEMIDYLQTALTAVYGESVKGSEQEVYEIASAIAMASVPADEFRNAPICRWTAAGDTSVYLVLENESLEILYIPPDFMDLVSESEKETVNTTGL